MITLKKSSLKYKDTNGNMQDAGVLVENGGNASLGYELDTTLTQSGMAADAKAVGEKFDDVVELLDGKVSKSDIVDNLTSDSSTLPLSAKQGKVLAEARNYAINSVYSNSQSGETKTISFDGGKFIQFSVWNGGSTFYNPIMLPINAFGVGTVIKTTYGDAGCHFERTGTNTVFLKSGSSNYASILIYN